ncbi:MAG TPA: IS30 family transposase [Acidimicrobiales bacterium]|nr:IS30 family transposase [Acidimicrobiales bacterium]
MGAHLTDEQRRLVRKLRRDGVTVAEVAREIGCSLRTVKRVAVTVGKRERRRIRWCPGPARLSLREREEISLGLGRGETFTAIARQLGRATSTVSREVKANGGREAYRAWRGHDAAYQSARRPKTTKLATCPRLAAQVEEWLEQWWSPEEIARRLPIEFPHDPMMRVSHETIYQSIFVQGRGQLARELARCLRSGRAQRRPRDRVETRGRICDMVMISDRPPDVEDRAVPGHWEGDLIIGKNGGSAVGTLVERTTGYVLLLHLPEGREAERVDAAMRRAVAKLPGELFRTITWDQGKEMARHAAFSIDTGIQVYFCDPHSPWQRPSNENTNGLLRQYMPKGTDLSLHTEAELDTFARSLNNRPRKRLGFMKPSERLAGLLATTA